MKHNCFTCQFSVYLEPELYPLDWVAGRPICARPIRPDRDPDWLVEDECPVWEAAVTESWRKGRRCATCGHYDEDDGCTRYEIVLPCYPGFDEMDPGMGVPLFCWKHASDIKGGE